MTTRTYSIEADGTLVIRDQGPQAVDMANKPVVDANSNPVYTETERRISAGQVKAHMRDPALLADVQANAPANVQAAVAAAVAAQ